MIRPQAHWDLRAALNFTLGGAGAGLMIAAAFLPGSNTLPILVSLALVAGGLGAVWLEIGRKLRALHVFFNPFTSWMTRESFAALLLFPLGLGAALTLQFTWAPALAAGAFLWCQARILRAAKGIPAWRAAQIVPLVVTTGLAEGFGLALLFGAGDLMLGLFAAAVVARLAAWRGYRAAVKPAALERAGTMLLWLGTFAALSLAVAAAVVPAAAPLAGLAAVAAGWRLKVALVTRAAFKQQFVLPHLPVRGVR